MKSRILSICGLLIILIMPMAQAEEVKVSVLYFDNLGEQGKYAALGKAISSMLVSDLSSVKGLVLIERDNVEKVMKELALGLSGATEEETSPKIGKLLGARYLVTGTYLVARRNVSANYKLIEVESGKIITAGTANGQANNILKVTGSLASSVAQGLKKAIPALIGGVAASDAGEVSIENVEAYGTALDLKDNGDYEKAQSVLKSLLGTVPKFTYGRQALSDLEKRIQEYDAERQRLLDEQKNKPVTWQNFNQITMSYMTSMKYSALLAYCEKIKANPPPAPEGAMISTAEMIAYYTVLSVYSLKNWDRVAIEGEVFLKAYPASMYYNSVKMYLTQAMQEMKTLESRIAQADAEAKPIIEKAAAASEPEKNTLYYQIASIYFGKQLYAKSLDFYKKINMRNADKNIIPPDLVLFNVFMCYYSLADKPNASRVAKTMEMLYPQSNYLTSLQSMITMFPE